MPNTSPKPPTASLPAPTTILISVFSNVSPISHITPIPPHIGKQSPAAKYKIKSKKEACMDAVDKRQVTHLSTQEGTCPNHPLHHADHCHPHLHTFAPSLPPLHHHNHADLPEMVETSRLWVSAGAVVRECGLFSPLCSTAAQCTQLLSTVLQK